MYEELDICRGVESIAYYIKYGSKCDEEDVEL
jgi:hypothetical protein